jgi:hypothetical protein
MVADGLRNRKFHELLAQQAASTAPTPSWGAALARALQGGMAGLLERGDNAGEMEANKWQAGLLGQQAQQTQTAQPSPLVSAMSQPQQQPQQSGNFGNAIASIESGGKYDILGPVTKTGDRAYGKYQVMGANVPQWTKAHLGQEMTPQAFLADPKAQDAVFNGQFGQYAQKYGPEGAAKAWFAGEKGMNNPNARDQLGTTVSSYAQKFNRALGPQGDVQTQLAQGPVPSQMGQPQQAPDANAALRAQIQQALTNPNERIRQRAQPYAAGIINKQLEGDKPTDEIREYNLYKQQGGNKSFFDYKADLKKAGAVNVSQNVGGGSDKQIFDTMDESAKAARQTAAGLTGLREARTALQGGAITGAGANQILGLQKVASALGLANSDKIVNTETFRAAIAPQVAAVLKSTVGTTNISNTDREFAERAAGGDIRLDGKSLERLLDIMERAGTTQLKGHMDRLEKVYPDATKYARERALFGVDTPPPGAPQEQPKIRKFNPATGKIE